MPYYQASNIKQKDKEGVAIALEIIPLPRSHLVPKLFATRTSPNSVTKSLQTLERFKTIRREGKTKMTVLARPSLGFQIPQAQLI